MSSNLPPTGPPSGPSYGPPSGPPAGQGWGPPPPPPPTAAHRPEYLESGAGGPVPPPPPTGTSGGGKRRGLLVGGGIVALLAVAGGAFGVHQVFFATGPQPAEALPASTVGYVSVDLDPSGKQKLAALDALEKFPAFQDNVDIDSDDDLREKLFEYVQDTGACPDLSWKDDIEPWLGDRFAFAAVDVGEELAPDDQGIAPVGVVQVEDADAAEKGLEAIRDCAEGSGGGLADAAYVDAGAAPAAATTAEEDAMGGWSVRGDWVVIAESDEVAEAVTDAAAEDPLSEDDDFTRWTEATGDPGIASAYASPRAGDLIVEAISSDLVGMTGSLECMPEPYDPGSESDEYGYDDCTDDASEDEALESLKTQFEGFEGAALTVRFEDSGLEIESASSIDFLGLSQVYDNERGDDVVAGLPDDTAIAVGLGFDEGWFTTLADYVGSASGGMLDVDEGIAWIEEETGLSLPEDAETLAGESAALAIGGDFDPESLEDDPSGQPLGVKVKGDPDAITGIVDRLLESPEVAGELKDEFAYQTDDDHVVAGFSDDWSTRLLEGGDLGGTDAYSDVVRESDDAAAVIFVNFDAGDWLTRAVEADGGGQDVLDNVEPLEAAGLSAWTDDDVSHSVFRLTVD